MVSTVPNPFAVGLQEEVVASCRKGRDWCGPYRPRYSVKERYTVEQHNYLNDKTLLESTENCM